MANGHEGPPVEGITGIESFRGWMSGFRSRVIEHYLPEQMIQYPHPNPGPKDERYIIAMPWEPWQLYPPTIKERLRRHYIMLEARELRVGVRIDRSAILFTDEVQRTPTDIFGHHDIVRNLSPVTTLTLPLDHSWMDSQPGVWEMQEIPEQDQLALKQFTQGLDSSTNMGAEYSEWIAQHLSGWLKKEPATVDEMREIAQFIKVRAISVSVEKSFITRHRE